MLNKDLQKVVEFIIESKDTAPGTSQLEKTPVEFTITPDSLQNVKIVRTRFYANNLIKELSIFTEEQNPSF